MPLATTDVLERTLFTDGIAGESENFAQAVAHYFDTVGRLDPFDALNMPRWIPRVTRLRARPAFRCFARTVDAVLTARKRLAVNGTAPPPNGLVAALLGAHDQGTGRGLTMEEVRNNIRTFIAVGSETAATALTWTLFLLSLDPDWRERVEQEVDRELPGGRFTEGAPKRLVATRAVIEEALRLYPPAPITTREAIGPDEFGGLEIAPGTTIVIAPWVLHRHRRLWDEPDVFDPARFLPGAREAIARFAWLPFGAGPRTCIGGAFALQEMTILLARIVRSFRLEPAPGHRVWPVQRITLRPRGGMPMILRRR